MRVFAGQVHWVHINKHKFSHKSLLSINLSDINQLDAVKPITKQLEKNSHTLH